MRRNLNRPEIPWAIDVPSDHLTLLRELLPIRGAQTWAINTGLRAFLDLMEADVSRRRWAHHQIATYDRPALRDRSELNIYLKTELYLRFGELFPEHGAATWTVRCILAEIIEMLKSGPTLDERIAMSVTRAMTPTEEEFDVRPS